MEIHVLQWLHYVLKTIIKIFSKNVFQLSFVIISKIVRWDPFCAYLELMSWIWLMIFWLFDSSLIWALTMHRTIRKQNVCFSKVCLVVAINLSLDLITCLIHLHSISIIEGSWSWFTFSILHFEWNPTPTVKFHYILLQSGEERRMWWTLKMKMSNIRW